MKAMGRRSLDDGVEAKLQPRMVGEGGRNTTEVFRDKGDPFPHIKLVI